MRVIAGEWRGRRLCPPGCDGLRPTSDKLRETLFNVVAARIAGARVLDAYAGTGAVGIEAMSRGASHVTFVEQDVRAIRLIEQNLAACRASEETPHRYTVVRADVTKGLTVGPGDITLAFLDPPYADLDITAALMSVRAAITSDGLAVLEQAARVSLDLPEGWQATRTLVSGDSILTFLQPTSPTV